MTSTQSKLQSKGQHRLAKGRESVTSMEWKITSSLPVIESNGGHRLAEGRESILNVSWKGRWLKLKGVESMNFSI